MIDDVYILGAGASVEAGAPIMDSFLDKAEDILRENGFRDRTKIEQLFSTIHELNSVSSKAKIDLNNIESILGAFEMSEILDFPLDSLGTDSIKDLKKSYITMLAETIEQSMKFKIQDRTYIEPHSSITNFVKTFKNKTKTSAVLTFNYDIGLDIELFNNRINYDYYLNSDHKLSGKFPILKLHGSINWCELEGNKITPIYFSDFFKKRSYSFAHSENGIFSIYDYIKAEFTSNQLSNEYFIIPPTWNKTIYHKTISNVWKKAAQCLSEARNIYVIGYSLPDSDIFFRYLYALGTLSRTRIRRFWVFNPDSSVIEDRFKNLLGPQSVDKYKYHQVKFSEVPDILNK